MASPKRAKEAKIIADNLNLDYNQITWDDRPNGGDAMYTARKAWLHPITKKNITHRLVLQDDIIVCDDLLNIVEKIALSHPNSAFGFTTFNYPREALFEHDSPYFHINWFPGQSIMLPIKYINSLFDWCDTNPYPDLATQDDNMIATYCQTHNIEMLSTIPQLVQHKDDRTILNCQYDWPRQSCIYSQHPIANWDNKDVRPSYTEWFNKIIKEK